MLTIRTRHMERHEMALGQVWAHMQDWHANGRGGPCVLGDMAQERLLCKGSMSALVTKVCRSRTAVWTAARDGTVRENGAVRLDRCGAADASLTATSQRAAGRNGTACVCACVRHGRCRRRAYAVRAALGCRRRDTARAASIVMLRDSRRSEAVVV